MRKAKKFKLLTKLINSSKLSSRKNKQDSQERYTVNYFILQLRKFYSFTIYINYISKLIHKKIVN